MHDAGASSFLYPFLDEREDDLEAVVEDVRRSVLMKAGEVGALREQTLTENAQVLVEAAGALRASFERGGKLLALGNGGSATDAMDVVADFRAVRPPRDRPDRGPGDPDRDRQRHRRRGDLLAPGHRLRARRRTRCSRCRRRATRATSSTRWPRRAAAGCRRSRWSATTAAGSPSDGLADHVVITRSEHIPRIQEAQASAYHALRELVG